jgi:hypothetical protein
MKESMMDIKCMLHSSVQLLTGIFYAPVNTWRVAVSLRAETHAGLLVNCPLLLSECL